MPSRCCVTRCRGNYDGGPKVSIFKFPEDEELKRKWLKAIPRKDFEPTKSSRVCELHFCPSDVMRVTEIYDEKTGKKFSAPLTHPRLLPTAIPSVFPDCPTYLSSSHQPRVSVEEKRLRQENKAIEKALAESIIEKEAYDSRVKVSSFAELCEKVNTMELPQNVSIIKKPNVLVFAVIDLNPAPVIAASAVVTVDLEVSIFAGSMKTQTLSKDFVIPEKLTDMNELSNILEHLKLVSCSSAKGSPNFDVFISMLHNLETNDNVDNNIVTFLSEQMKLLDCKKECRRYSSDLLIWTTLLYSISPHAYRFLMSCKNFILPHPSTLRRMTSKFQLNPKFEQQEQGFLSYIRSKFPLLSEFDRKVILMIDEIHLKPFFDFKGGSLFGASYDTVNAATTAYVFMLQSLLSPLKDVIHILPVSKITAENLFSFLKKIVIGLEKIGFMVIAVVSDNNAINRKAMSFFSSPPCMSIVYKHPIDPSRPLFFCIDTVHLLKCIRNNWINQKNCGQSLFFPDFNVPIDSEKRLLTASFSALKKMHELESGENLLKYGFGLTMKALNPSNLERQNVSLALKIFNRYMPEALREIGEKHNLLDYSSTAMFIEIICTWFEIMNVKTPNKGKRLNNIYQEPVTMKEDDDRRVFLQNFLLWLDLWKEKNCTTGTFTKETHQALTHTTHALLEMCQYCIEELKLQYFLPGKVQTDSLEDRFGQYRQLSGSNYNISICQVFESETKLRMQNFLPLTVNSSKFGQLKITDFDENEVVDDDDQECEALNFRTITVTQNDLNAIDVLPIITYLAGYCVYKLLMKLHCHSCSNNLTLDKQLDLDVSYRYIRNLDRGGLLCPHQEIVQAVSFNYVVVKKLLSKDYECQFLKMQNQRNVVTDLTFQVVMEKECLSFDQCAEGHSLEYILKYVLRASTNTFLKNYCSQKNDVKKENKSKKRKLQTLSKQPISF